RECWTRRPPRPWRQRPPRSEQASECTSMSPPSGIRPVRHVRLEPSGSKQRPRGGYHPRGQFVQLKRWKSGGGLSGADFLLDAQRQRRQVGIVLLEQEGIEATAVLDGAQRRSRHAQLDRTVQ